MKLTENQLLYSYLHVKYKLTFAEIARAFNTTRQNVSQIVRRLPRKSLHVNFLKIKFGDPPKILIAKKDRECPHCSARPGPRLMFNINNPRRDLDLLRDKSGGLCHACGWSF